MFSLSQIHDMLFVFCRNRRKKDSSWSRATKHTKPQKPCFFFSFFFFLVQCHLFLQVGACNESCSTEESQHFMEEDYMENDNKTESTIDIDHVLCYAQLQLSLTIGLSSGVPVMVMEHKGLFYYSDNVDFIGKAACSDRNSTYGHS